jgi:positive phototaxis protein PixI
MSIANYSKGFNTVQISLPDGQNQQQRHKFVEFQLSKDNLALLPAQTIIEIRTIKASEILPVPQLPSCVLGMCQWRGEMLWIVDLRHLLNLAPLSWQSNNLMMVLSVESKILGLAIAQVTRLENYDLKDLRFPSADLFLPELLPFLQGFFLIEKQKMVKLLNPEAIINFNLSRIPSFQSSLVGQKDLDQI